MKTHLTFAAAAFALAAAGAHAAPQDTYGEEYPDYTQSMTDGSSLSREAVVADLMQARRAGTLPRYGEWDSAPAPKTTRPAR